MNWPATLPLFLEERKHRVLARGLITEMDGARLRSRRSNETSIELVDVQWNFTQDQFDQFKTFYEDELVNGALAFLVGLGGDVVLVAFFEGYTFAHSDNLYVVSAALEVDADANSGLEYNLGEESGDDESVLDSDESGGEEVVLDSDPGGSYSTYLVLDYYGGNVYWSDLTASQRTTALALMEDYMTRVLGITPSSQSQKWWGFYGNHVVGKSIVFKEDAGSMVYGDGIGDGTILFGDAYALILKYNS